MRLGQVFSPPLRSPGSTSRYQPTITTRCHRRRRPRLTPRPQPRSPQQQRQFLRRQLSLWCQRPRRRPPRHFPLVDNRDAQPIAAVVEALRNPVLPDNLRPSVYDAPNDTSSLYDTTCHQFMAATVTDGCVFGDVDSEFTIGLIGDSHAAQWFAAVNTIATERGWRLARACARWVPASRCCHLEPRR